MSILLCVIFSVKEITVCLEYLQQPCRPFGKLKIVAFKGNKSQVKRIATVVCSIGIPKPCCYDKAEYPINAAARLTQLVQHRTAGARGRVRNHDYITILNPISEEKLLRFNYTSKLRDLQVSTKYYEP